MNAGLTANNLSERLAGGGFMSYQMIWPRLEPIVAGLATDAYIKTAFSPYPDDPKQSWKNDALQDVARLLRDHFGGRGRWQFLSGAGHYALPVTGGHADG